MNLWPIIKLSWKNIWRNKVRSGVVIVSVLLGTCAGVFMTAFMYGLSMGYVKIQLQNFTSHLQIHTEAFEQEEVPEAYIPDVDSLVQSLKQEAFITAISERSVITGLAASSSSSYGVTITGIDTDQERKISLIHTHIIEGDYLEGDRRNEVLIGQKLAERLGLKIRSKMVLNFQDVDGNISAGAFRVSGIFKSPNSQFDEANVFVKATDLNRLIGKPDAVHEIAILVDNFKMADQYKDSLSTNSGLVVESWGDLSPSLRYTDATVGTTLYIVMVIILIALTFGIVNTMLMAVLERQQELGMLMSVGVNKIRIFTMILFETFFLAIFGAPIGVFFAWIGISVLSETGVDVSAFSQGFEMYGLGTVIYPELQPGYYLNIGLLIMATTLIASLYPSFKALKLNPVEAIRKI